MSSEEPLSARLRRAGEQDRTERRAWANLVQEELRGDAQSAAAAFGAETLARSPLSQLVPGAAVADRRSRPARVGDRDAYTEWHPYTSAPGGVPPPHGVVVEPAADPEPFVLLLLGRDHHSGELTRVVRVILAQPSEFGGGWWNPVAEVQSVSDLARLLAGVPSAVIERERINAELTRRRPSTGNDGS